MKDLSFFGGGQDVLGDGVFVDLNLFTFGVVRDHHEGNRAKTFVASEFGEDLPAVHVGDQEAADHGVRGLLADHPPRRTPVGGRVDLETFGFKDFFKRGKSLGIAVHKKDKRTFWLERRTLRHQEIACSRRGKEKRGRPPQGERYQRP